MEENKNIENVREVKVDSVSGDGVEEKSDTTTKADEATESITMFKTEYDKAIQSAEDKVRGKMSKTIKELEKKVSELSPVEKTPEQIDLENRLAALEAKEKAVADRERKALVQEQLINGGLDKGLADYLKDDVDVDALSSLVNEIVKSRLKSNGYVPQDHSSDDKVTPEDFKKMTYTQRVALQTNKPDLFRRLSGKK
nr:MAG TPA: protein of unknown function (DUF4355) [Caudoviricetes sp.]